MPADYPLELLGPDDFQRVAQALALEEFPGFQAFPIGMADGGRDGTAVVFKKGKRRRIVVQVKFHRKPLSVSNPHKWVQKILAEEIPKIRELVSSSNAAEYVLITNVPATSTLNSGSIDKVDDLLKGLPIPGRCWWRGDVTARLDLTPALHWAYPQLLTGADVLKWVGDTLLTTDAERRLSAIRAYLRNQHEADLHVRFRQVELVDTPLLDVFIDVPTSLEPLWDSSKKDREHDHLVARALLERRKARVDPADLVDEEYGPRISWIQASHIGAATLLLAPEAEGLPQVVVEGAPGQGKSTLAQYVCQVHRMRLLGEPLDEIAESHRTGPSRLPFKIELRDYAGWLGRSNPFEPDQPVPANWGRSLEEFITAQIAHSNGGIPFDGADLAAVLKVSAVVIVLDGLDEVADLAVRETVVNEVTIGIQRMREYAYSVQAIVTSRPAAFANSPGFPPAAFRYFTLKSIPPRLVKAYAERWMASRHLSPTKMADIRRVIATKLGEPHMKELARNPMQLSILLTLIETRGASLPDERTALYDAYINTFFNREAEKNDAVREHRVRLTEIHGYLAWLLHTEAESENPTGRIAAGRLKDVVRRYLISEGHDGELTDVLFDGIVERVVALVSRVEDTYEFEVQPLREYFAARYLYDTTPYSPPGGAVGGALPDRFDALIRNGHWLNVARFFAGCCSKGQLASLAESVEALAVDPAYKHTLVPRELAAMLLGDWVFDQSPRSIPRIVDVVADDLGMRLLADPKPFYGKISPRLALPHKAGGERLAELAWARLDRDLAIPKGFAYQAAAVVQANGALKESYEPWLERTLRAEGPARDRWVSIGLKLGVLGRAAESDLDQILGEGAPSPARLRTFFRAGHIEYCESNEERASALLGSILDCQDSIFSRRDKRLSPLAALSFVLTEPTGYGYSDYWPSGLSEPGPSESATVQRVREVFRQGEPVFGAGWERNRGGWMSLEGAGRELLGDGWAWRVLSFALAYLPRSDDDAAHDLCDESVSPILRVQTARQRPGAASWWVSQLEQASGASVPFVTCLAALCAGPRTLIKLATPLDRALLSLGPHQREQVLQVVENAHSPYSMGWGRRRADAETVDGRDFDESTVVLFGLRAEEEVQNALSAAHLAEYEGSSPIISRFRVRAELRSAVENDTDWNSALASVEHAYAIGGSRTWDFFGGHHDQISQRIPVAAAIRVLERPLSFPEVLLQATEARVSEIAAEQTVPVGHIASNDKWFD